MKHELILKGWASEKVEQGEVLTAEKFAELAKQARKERKKMQAAGVREPA